MSTDVQLPEPVAWLQAGQPDSLNAGDVIARTYLPKRYDEKRWRFDPLYTADQLASEYQRGLTAGKWIAEQKAQAAVAEARAVPDGCACRWDADDKREPDRALSFAPDNFPLEGVLGFRSIAHAAIHTADQLRAYGDARAAALAGVLRLVVGDAEMFCRAAHHSKADRHEAFEPCPIHTRAVAALLEMTTKQSSECHWSQDGDEDSDVWATQCGNMFTIIADTPSENEMRFCCFCGKSLVEIRFEDEHE